GASDLRANTFGQGNAGTVKITATDSVKLNGKSKVNSQVGASGVGNAGGVDISTNSLELLNSSFIDASTFGKGDAGSITINTPELNIANSAVISASNVNGLGGNINITANKLTANNGANIVTRTSGSAKAGNINLNIKDNITLDGKTTGLFANTQIGSTGDSGSINIDPEIFVIRNGAGIGVNSQGSGKGGNISIQAGTLTLDNKAFMTAETINNEGGEITLNINDLLWMRRGSSLTATAGTSGAGGNGGNININVPFMISFASENNDITANAFEGNGGQINITTNTIFGLKFKPEQTNFSDITASSQFGLSGQVTINRLDVDPARGLVSLPVNLLDASSQLGQGCRKGRLARQENRFNIIGKGGLPSHPGDLFTGTTPLVNLVDIQTTKTSQETIKPVVIDQNNQKVNLKNRVIQQAQGWVFTNDGKVILTAETPQATVQNSSLNNPGCEVFSQ
ncbi:S-layer family protein, partial [Anabaena sp. FACHB-1237]